MRPDRHPPVRLALAALAALATAACGDGARIEARPQSIAFGPAPTPAPNVATATVRATASSGLPVRYGSKTPALCSVDASSGLVTASATGTCVVSANQDGNSTYAAAAQATQGVAFVFAGVVIFGPAPAMAVYDLATVTATESSGAAVAFSTATPAVCTVDPAWGVVAALAPGDCTIDGDAGDARASLSFVVSPPAAPSSPGAPTVVRAAAGPVAGTVEVAVGAVAAGGMPIAGYTVTSIPPGLAASGVASPIPVDCGGSCSGYRFAVSARNAAGSGASSLPVNVVTRYRVLATFREPDTRPNDSIFDGAFTLDSSAGVVTGLRGRLSEPMTGGPLPYPDDTMTWLDLRHQLSAVPVTLDGADGWLVATFLLDDTGTLSSDPRFGGTDGWSPGTGQGLHQGYPGENPGNAYVLVFVNAAEPTAAPAQGQLDRIAYADCAPGGMMGATCMTGTSAAGYGTPGTMGGYPASQVTTRDGTGGIRGTASREPDTPPPREAR